MRGQYTVTLTNELQHHSASGLYILFHVEIVGCRCALLLLWVNVALTKTDTYIIAVIDVYQNS